MFLFRSIWCAMFLLLADVTAAAPFFHFEARQTHPIALTPNGARLLALNSPDARLSVFDVSNPANPTPVLVAEIPVGLEPVSVRARTDDEVWVVNEVSDTISIVSLSLGAVVETLRCPDEPADVVFAQGKAFVTCARNALLRVFDVATRLEASPITLAGVYPRALATDAAGTKVFVTFQLSGNRTTVLPASQAPPQPAPANTNLPAPPQTALIISADDPRIGYSIADRDVAEISAALRRVTRYYTNVGTILFDIAERPGTSELWIPNTEALNLTRFEPNLKGHFADNRVTRLVPDTGEATAFDLNAGYDYSMPLNPAAQAIALAQPAAIVFSADGSHAWVAAFASDRIAKLDAASGTVTSRVDLRAPAGNGIPENSRQMRGPRGIALHEGRQQLFVLNKLANTISVIALANVQVVAELPAGSHDPTPAVVKEGRGFLFDARLSGNGTASCGTCHVDGDRDGLAWDLGDPNGEMATVIGANLAVHDTRPQLRTMHPMKGPMVTQTLRGLQTNQLLHWRGDRPTLHQFNATFRDLMGGTLIGDPDIDALKTYLDTLRHHPNPNRNLDNTLPATFNGGNPTRGRSLFTVHINHCGVCHVLPTGSDNNVDDLRNFGGLQSIKTPPLQTVYQRALLDTRAGAVNAIGFGLGHDGTGGKQFLPTVHFYELDELVGQDFADVTAFLMCFETGVAPAVGFHRTIAQANRSDAALNAELDLAEAQARAGACALVVRGRFNGQPRAFLYETASQRYRTDRAGEATLARVELLAQLAAGDALSFLGVPPGNDARFGQDRDGDGVWNGDEPSPGLGFAKLPSALRLSWSVSAGEWLLESSDAFAAPWQPVLLPRSIAGGVESVEPPFNESLNQFFRLRRVW